MSENLGNQGLQQEIAQMEQALAAKRQVLESQQAAGEINELPHPKDTLREIIGEQGEPTVPPAGQPPPVTNNDQKAAPPAVLPPPPIEPPSYLSPELREQVQSLVNTAFTQSISQAIQQARATNNAALVDAFHDVLADELYKLLIERGKLPSVK